MRVIPFTLMSILFVTALVAEPAKNVVYKWVDESGVIHYSDQPHENAQKVQLKAPQTYTAPPMPAAPQSSSTGQSSNPVPLYQSCVVSEPTPDQMYMNTSEITAGVSVTPAIREGDHVVVMVDGQQVPGIPPGGGQFTVSPVDRGTHSIQMMVQDGTGRTVCQSPSVTFHVHQPSVLSPSNPVRPR